MFSLIRSLPGRRHFSTLLRDTHHRFHNYLRISLTERCNLRCQYCMPDNGISLTPSKDILQTDEILRLATLFASAGVDKIRLTGGEPTLRKDITDIIKGIGEIGNINILAMTTNGLTLKRHLPHFQKNGLNALNISLDTLVEAKFNFFTRRKGFTRVIQSINMAIELGFNPVKINCVVMRGYNEDEIMDFVNLTRNKPINVRFIEFMPFDDNNWSSKRLYPYFEILDKIKEQYPEITRLQDHFTDTAKNYKIPQFEGSISFITSMTEHFCGGCNRTRLLADGNYKVCLFGPNEVSLRDMMRMGCSDNDLLEIISQTIDNKKFSHNGMTAISKSKNRPMIMIGG